MAIQYGVVPIYGYVDRYKADNTAWDDLGQRNPKFVVLHRMVGTLRGTDSYFGWATTKALTDFGIGTATSDPGLAGVIYKWNDPRGRRSGWASGPVNGAYGDGLAIVQKYGIAAVNRDGISLEIGGTNEPIDDFTWNEIVHFIAYWADQCKVPWTTFPLNPATGISFVIWHNEFTNGTGKQCPFMWLRDRTDKLIEDVKNFLRKYQEGDAAVVKPSPVPAPAPAPKPAPAPAPAPTTVKRSGAVVGDTMEATEELNVRQGSATKYPVMHKLKVGEKVVVIEGGRVEDGREWLNVRGPWGTGWTASEWLKKSAVPVDAEVPKIERYKAVNGVEFYFLGEKREGKEITFLEDTTGYTYADNRSKVRRTYRKGEKAIAYFYAVGEMNGDERLWYVMGKDISTAPRVSFDNVLQRPY